MKYFASVILELKLCVFSLSLFSLLMIYEQVVAITVFFLLSIAYYAFFAPFLGKDIFEYVAIGVYSLLVSSTLIFLRSPLTLVCFIWEIHSKIGCSIFLH